VDDYDAQLNLALRPVIDAAKLVVTGTSQVVVAVIVFVLAVHVASAVLRYYFRLVEDAAVSTTAAARNVYVTAHSPSVAVGAAAGGGADDDGTGSGTLTMRLRKSPVRGAGEADRGGAEYDSAGDDDHDAAVGRRAAATSSGTAATAATPSTSALLTLRTARRTSATMSSQSTLDFKYSETKV